MEEDGLEGVASDAEDHFNAAATFLAAAVAGKDARFDDKLKLRFYGLYKQATAGKCAGGRPGFWDVAGRAKWDAWAEVGDMPKPDAMQRYAALLSQIAPEWEGEAGTSTQAKSKGGMGPVFSSLAQDAAGEDDGAPITLHELAGQGDVEGLTALLDGGTPIDSRDDMGCTALHFAADRGSVEAARALLAAGADVNAQDDEGQTPLHYAAVTEHREVYDLLVEAKANASVRDAQGQTAAEAAPSAWGVT